MSLDDPTLMVQFLAARPKPPVRSCVAPGLWSMEFDRHHLRVRLHLSIPNCVCVEPECTCCTTEETNGRVPRQPKWPWPFRFEGTCWYSILSSNSLRAQASADYSTQKFAADPVAVAPLKAGISTLRSLNRSRSIRDSFGRNNRLPSEILRNSGPFQWGDMIPLTEWEFEPNNKCPIS